MRTLGRRVAALEHIACPAQGQPWHRVLVDVGQTEAEAIAAFEAENGPVGDTNLLIFRFIRPGGDLSVSSAGMRPVRT